MQTESLAEPVDGVLFTRFPMDVMLLLATTAVHYIVSLLLLLLGRRMLQTVQGVQLATLLVAMLRMVSASSRHGCLTGHISDR